MVKTDQVLTPSFFSLASSGPAPIQSKEILGRVEMALIVVSTLLESCAAATTRITGEGMGSLIDFPEGEKKLRSTPFGIATNLDLEIWRLAQRSWA